MPHDLDAGPPAAPAAPSTHTAHGVARVDDYAWMRDHDDPRLAEYLRTERRHYDVTTNHLQRLRSGLFSEVERRLPQTDSSVSWKRGDFFYYTRTPAGSEYEQFVATCNATATSRPIVDGAEFSDTSGYVEFGLREPSPDGRLLAYSVDTTGDEVYRLRFRDTATLTDLDDYCPRTYYTGAWSADSRTFFYTVHDDLYRPYQVWRHRIGGESELVFEEPDVRYEVSIGRTTGGAFIVIRSECRDTSEAWLIPADRPEEPPVVVAPRRKGVEYRVDHCPTTGEVFIVTNDGAVEFQLARVSTSDTARWSVAAAPRPGERLLAVHVLRDHLLLDLRRAGFPLLRVVDRATGTERELAADLPAGSIALATEVEYAASEVTVRVESLVEPPVWYGVDLRTGARTPRKRQETGDYDPARYRTERRHAPAPDGTLVPVTLAWRADTPLDGTAPCLQYGYGAYEVCEDPAFDPMLPSLLDRGVVYAVAHVRGGGENGRAWWLDGHLERKRNTFTDHIAVADWLASSGLVDGARIATRGLSAGGLLQGVAYTWAPRRWRAVIAEVPFVDVVTTMLDERIPLTANEWDEWGDPRREADFGWLRAYSPYDNAPAGRRPPLLVTGAVHDPRVMVHEPAKWVAKLRATAHPDDGPVLFRVELGAGAHTGPAGRYEHYRYEAEILAWVLDRLAAH
ncbi:S9 family peptidase [Rhizomonospora bruguierae]|uniref:S9 family peptidase n=1 Tax=Rhizomonospora bruguierae TaxID=1581705 RepID=UPI001BCB2593|nr:prolyl oligopeptidase family serine peptidase [Micromonospora sp. NBRC 107566]